MHTFSDRCQFRNLSLVSWVFETCELNTHIFSWVSRLKEDRFWCKVSMDDRVLMHVG
jgi:hypothetical protein